MSEIKDTDYITVKRGQDGQIGVFVGGKPATTYRGQEIYDIDYVKRVFEWMEKQCPNIAEFHIMSSITSGEYAETGNPLPGKSDDDKNAIYAWCRIVLNDSSAAPWVFYDALGSAGLCAYNCAHHCAYAVRDAASFRSAVLGFVTNTKDRSIKGPKVYNLFGYRITVEKFVKKR